MWKMYDMVRFYVFHAIRELTDAEIKHGRSSCVHDIFYLHCMDYDMKAAAIKPAAAATI